MNERMAIDTAAQCCATMSSEYRVRILHALFEAERPLGYSELMSATDERDSGRFNYHLDKLKGVLITKGEEGYYLNLQGKLLMSSIAAGRYGDVDSSYSVTLDRVCPECHERPLSLIQRGMQPEIGCQHCDLVFTQYGPFPPTAWEAHEIDDVPHALWARIRHDVTLALEDICYDCYSPLERSVREKSAETSLTFYPERSVPYWAYFSCTTCTNTLPMPYSYVAWFSDDVGHWLMTQGIDPDAVPGWQFDSVVDELAICVDRHEPVRVSASIVVDGDHCDVTIDQTHRVIDR